MERFRDFENIRLLSIFTFFLFVLITKAVSGSTAAVFGQSAGYVSNFGCEILYTSFILIRH